MARVTRPARLCGVTRLLVVLVALAGALSSISLAAAHAEPARATPGDKAVLDTAPSEIVFEMSQEMARQEGQNDIDVLDAAGNEVTTIAAVIDNNDRRRLSVVLPSGLQPGTYTARWKTLSAEDGDPATGETTFTYDPAATPSEGTVALRPGPVGRHDARAHGRRAGACWARPWRRRGWGHLGPRGGGWRRHARPGRWRDVRLRSEAAVRRWAAFVAVLAGCLLALAQAPSASAHAALVSSEPASNAFLRQAPGEVRLVFAEPVDSRSSTIEILDAAGRPVATGRPSSRAQRWP